MQFRIGPDRVTVNLPDAAAVAAAVAARMTAGQGFALATLNLDHLVKLRFSPAFRRAYAAQDLITADGWPVAALARLSGAPVDRAPGADLILPLAALARDRGVAVAPVGTTAPALDVAATSLMRQVPGLRIAARIAPSQGFDPEGDEAARLLQALAASGAGLTFLALGAPKQERFAARGRDALPAMGFVSIGAGLDFLAGAQRRAPGIWRRAGLEWAWRMLGDPWRLGPRYVRCALILPGLTLQALRARAGVR